jgi:uncharacterized membrane protein
MDARRQHPAQTGPDRSARPIARTAVGAWSSTGRASADGSVSRASADDSVSRVSTLVSRAGADGSPSVAERAQAVAAGPAGLVALYLLTVVAVTGYAVFGRDPSRLIGLSPVAVTIYAHSFGFFALSHIGLSMLVLALMLIARTGLRWLPSFALLYGISLASELAGTTWGIPFGEYRYSALLAPMWLDRVPAVIPLSWFCMAVASFALASRAIAGSAARIGVASVILLAWDLALDPAMSHATRYWIWSEAGPYYGMPWLNLLGWYVTGVVLMGALVLLRAERWTVRIGGRWWAGFYMANLLLPLGMCAAAGLWPAVFATILLLSIVALSLRVAVQRSSVEAAA